MYASYVRPFASNQRSQASYRAVVTHSQHDPQRDAGKHERHHRRKDPGSVAVHERFDLVHGDRGNVFPSQHLRAGVYKAPGFSIQSDLV